MRIVLIIPIPFWHPGTNELIQRLRGNNINIVAFDIFNALYINENNEQIDLVPFANGLIRKIYIKIFRKRIIRKILKEKDILDMQYVDCFYHKYINVFKEDGRKLIATFFGSDLYRNTHIKQQEWQSIILKQCDKIIMGENMTEKFNQDFPGLENKIFFNQYGSSRLDMICDIESRTTKDALKNKYKIQKNKIVITIGYNAKKEQQHLMVIDSLSKLNTKQKQELFLLIPLTYDRNKEYLELLNNRIKKLEIDNICFHEYLSNEALCETRIISDITINTQTTDALSSSIKEAFVANNILITGDWLPYDIYKEMGIKFIQSTESELLNNINNAINDVRANNINYFDNRKVIMEFASWEYLIPKWIKCYKEI